LNHPARREPPEQVEDFVAGNTYDKYGTKNPIHRTLMRRFLGHARALVDQVRPQRVLEVGCGAGELAGQLFGPLDRDAGPAPDYVGIDLSAEQVAEARATYPRFSFQVASVDELPFPDASFDLLVACEVLEHLKDPDAGMRELDRVCSGHLLLSVPWEPVWRLANVVRGAYLRQFGNTPGHLQHFSRRSIRKLVERRFDVVAERRPFPWTMILAHTRRAPSNPRRPR
jgi:ubiquinone/menaquinone biosynthesis C-methylase UbiE